MIACFQLGQTAVHLAAVEGHHDTVQHFLQIGVEVETEKEKIEIDDRDSVSNDSLPRTRKMSSLIPVVRVHLFF